MPSCLAHLPLPSRESTYRTVMHVFNFKDYVLYGTVVTTERLQTRETRIGGFVCKFGTRGRG